MPSTPAASKEAGAPAETEIEVTPEMIEAGVIHLYRYHPEKGWSDEDTVAAIYRDMFARRPQPDFARS